MFSKSFNHFLEETRLQNSELSPQPGLFITSASRKSGENPRQTQPRQLWLALVRNSACGQWRHICSLIGLLFVGSGARKGGYSHSEVRLQTRVVDILPGPGQKNMGFFHAHPQSLAEQILGVRGHCHLGGCASPLANFMLAMGYSIRRLAARRERVAPQETYWSANRSKASGSCDSQPRPTRLHASWLPGAWERANPSFCRWQR